MKLTPIDLQQKTFRSVRWSGVDEKEVRQYLDLVARELEEMRRKLDRQDEELRRREARINEFKDREQLLQQTLTTAQKLAEEMKANTRKEADIVLSDAELQAEKIIANAQAKRMQLITEIDELKRARQSFMQSLSAMLEQHRSVLDHIRADQQASEPPPVPAAGDNVSFLAPPVSKKK
ncbi:MAG: DivIVA domain-containing protein [Deltaproteobacteria bacterium]|nr:MAG: DivIVA domain-containing protein [Deltaproteobacteria bacterium]